MRYAAFLRGIGPGNPNMHNSKICPVFESLGFTDVKGVLASGNIVFTAVKTNPTKLEKQIQQALTKHLGLSSKAIVRSQRSLQHIVHNNPFEGKQHSRESYLTVTFLKYPPEGSIPVPHQSENKAINVFAYDSDVRAVFSITNVTIEKGSGFMVWFEKQFSKNITTRTWLSVQRILAACLKTQK